MNLEITDNQDGTGVTATVTGSGGGTVTFYYQPIDRTSYSTGGSRTGNGTISVSLDVGYFFGYAKEGSDVSNVVYFAATDVGDSVHDRCLRAVQSKIQSLLLPGVANDSIRVRKIPELRDFVGKNPLYSWPALLISPFGQETNVVATNVRDDVGYPVVISLIVDAEAQKNQDFEKRIEPYLKARETIARAFRYQRLAGVPEIWNTNIKPGAIYSPEVITSGIWAGYMNFEFVSREVRGS